MKRYLFWFLLYIMCFSFAYADKDGYGHEGVVNFNSSGIENSVQNSKTYSGTYQLSQLTVGTTVNSVTVPFNSSFIIQSSGDVYLGMIATGNVVTPNTTTDMFLKAGETMDTAPNYGLSTGNKISFVTATGTAYLNIIFRSELN